MSYRQHAIRVEFTLKNGQTFDDTGNVLTLSNLRTHLTMTDYGGLDGTSITLSIWGLSPQQMAAVSYRSFRERATASARMRVWADDLLIFEGFIRDAYADFNTAPDIALMITASMMADLRSKPAPPFSAQGEVRIDDVMMPMASVAGLKFENQGVQAVLNNPYFNGDVATQLWAAAQAVEAAMSITVNSVTIWPRGSARTAPDVLISPEHGLIGYPVFTAVGVNLSTLYSPELYFGRHVRLVTSLPNAKGLYTVNRAEHTLTSWTTGGQWRTDCSLRFAEVSQ